MLRRLAYRLRRHTLARRQEPPRRGPARVPRPARAGPRAAPRPASTGRPCARRCTSATSGCCSTSSRTPTRSRSSWPCASPRGARRRRRRLGATSTSPPGRLFVVGDPKQSIYRFRRADIATFLTAQRPDRRRGRRADDQLPHTRAGPRLGQRTSSPRSSSRCAGLAAGLPAAATRTARRPPARPTGPVRARAPTPTRRRPSADDAPRAARPPTSPPVDPRRPRRALAGARRATPRRSWRAVQLRRHHGPRARPHLAALPRGRPRRRRHPLPRRGQLARLPHPGGPRPARCRPRRRRPHRRARPGRRAALAAVRLRRRRPVHLAAAPAGAFNLLAPPPDAVAADHPVGRGASPTCARLHDDARRGSPQRAARPHRPRPPDARARPPTARARATCGGGCGSSSTRPARGARPTRRPARLPRLGRASRRRDRAGRRGRAARDRRRRGADHDHPRRQGPRVPDHDRVRPDQPRRRRPQRRRACSGPATAAASSSSRKDLQTEDFEAAKPIDEQMGYDERLRLLYVACTRARDHLVVSLHRRARTPPADPATQPHQRRAAGRRAHRHAADRRSTAGAGRRGRRAAAAAAVPAAAAAARSGTPA